MQLLPALDLRGGRCVRLAQGDFARETRYHDDPVEVAKSLAGDGAEWLHVVDLDGARGSGSNLALVEAIAASVDISVQVGGGVRDGSLLDAGATRVVVGSLLAESPELARELAANYPDRVVAGLDHRQGSVQIHGWETDSGIELAAALEDLSPAFAAVVVTDISRDGMLIGPDERGLAAAVASSPVPVVASGGIGSLADLERLNASGVWGAIVGRALYEGRFSLKEALATCAR